MELGVNPKIVAELLGHSNVTITLNLYSHVSPTMKDDAVSRMVAVLA
jgi:integrase